MQWTLWMGEHMTGGISGSKWQNMRDLNLEVGDEAGPEIGTRGDDHTREVGREVMTDHGGTGGAGQDQDQGVKGVKRINQDQETEKQKDQNLEKSLEANQDHAKDPRPSQEKDQ